MKKSVSHRPNIILLHWHDLGRFLSTYGRPGIETPNLDRMAEKGCVFDNAFCVAPLCSPSRAAMFTGRYPHANGMMGLPNRHPENWSYRPGEKTLPMYLKEAGYRTLLFGQQHEGRPEVLGFDEFHVPAPLCFMKPVTEMFTTFLRHQANARQPFFASVGFFEVHRHGIGYPPEVYGTGETDCVPNFLPDHPAVRRELYRFYQAIGMADQYVGQILSELEKAGLAGSTWIIFTTDHGIAFPRAKSTLYDAGIEAALMMRWPDVIEEGARIRSMFSQIDLLPTMLDCLGIDIPTNLHGRSRKALLLEREEESSHPVFAEKNFHTSYDPIRCIRTDRFKYIRNFSMQIGFGVASDIEQGEAYMPFRAPQPERPMEELYDLFADPAEFNNLAGDPKYAEVRKDLSEQLSRWMIATGDYLPERATDPPLGHEMNGIAA